MDVDEVEDDAELEEEEEDELESEEEEGEEDDEEEEEEEVEDVEEEEDGVQDESPQSEHLSAKLGRRFLAAVAPSLSADMPFRLVSTAL